MSSNVIFVKKNSFIQFYEAVNEKNIKEISFCIKNLQFETIPKELLILAENIHEVWRSLKGINYSKHFSFSEANNLLNEKSKHFKKYTIYHQKFIEACLIQAVRLYYTKLCEIPQRSFVITTWHAKRCIENHFSVMKMSKLLAEYKISPEFFSFFFDEY